MPAFHAKNAERLQGFSEAAIMPPGTILPYAGSTAPSGFLLCDGSAKSRATYSRLFDVLGTTYGAPDAANFNLPDMRGRVPAGRDDMGGSAALRLTSALSGINGQLLGASGGFQSHLLTASQSGLPAHTPTINDPGHTHNVSVYTTAGAASTWASSTSVLSQSAAIYRIATEENSTRGIANSTTTGVTINPVAAQNASAAHPIVQPTVVLNYIIKY
jgi:microcystin-dependent protein